jgi:ribosomal protein S3AE
VIVTFRKVEREKTKDIRKILETFTAKLVSANNFDAIMSMILQKDILYDILPDLKKIASIKKAELELVKLLS